MCELKRPQGRENQDGRALSAMRLEVRILSRETSCDRTVTGTPAIAHIQRGRVAAIRRCSSVHIPLRTRARTTILPAPLLIIKCATRAGTRSSGCGRTATGHPRLLIHRMERQGDCSQAVSSRHPAGQLPGVRNCATRKLTHLLLALLPLQPCPDNVLWRVEWCRRRSTGENRL